MNGSLPMTQVAGLVVSGLVGGAALLMLLLGGISKACDRNSSEARGCGVLGGFLLLGALVFAVWVLSAL